jgi:tartronate-semialdehyde synthase
MLLRKMNEFFDEDTISVTDKGLYQIWRGQFQKTYKPRHYLCCTGSWAIPP